MSLENYISGFFNRTLSLAILDVMISDYIPPGLLDVLLLAETVEL